jgi:hypothetical protein
MVKKIVFIVLELMLFLVVFLLGSVILPGANVLPVLSVSAGAGRIFVYDGLLLMLALYALLLLIGLARRRIAVAWQNPTIALVLALLLGLVAKFGFTSI